MPHRHLFLLALLLLALTTACDVVPAPGPAAIADEVPAQAAGLTPEQVAAGFLDAWGRSDYDEMYSYLADRSRELYPLPQFRDRYTVATSRMNLESISYSINGVELQGTSAAIRYDVTITSPTFGSIEDPNRIMRLVRNEGRWGIAWSTMDILDGLAPGAQIQLDTRFPTRGNIYDRNGNVLVEQGGPVVALYAIKNDMSNVDSCIDLLTRVMMRQRNSLVRQFANYLGETYFHVGEVDPEVYFANRTQLENTCGMYDTGGIFNKVATYNSRRYYGHGAIAHITGYVGRIPAEQLDFWQGRGYAAGDLVGLDGVERAYESQLAGTPERFLRIVEPGGAAIRELGGATGAPSQSMSLTINRELQMQVSQALVDAFNYAESNWAGVSLGGGAVVVDVNTGEILALASYPSYDPSLFVPGTSYDVAATLQRLGADPRSPFRNKAVQEQASPGSAYKILTAIAAAAEGVFGLDETFFCDLEWRGGERFGDVRAVRVDWRVAAGLDAAGELSMARALTASCNPFFWEMGALLFQRGPGLLVQYSELFGLGRRSGLDMLGPEAAGNLAMPAVMGQAVNNAVGQGDLTVTPIQMAMMTAAVANRGTLYQPYLVQSFGTPGSADLEVVGQPTVVQQIEIDPAIFDMLFEGMCAVPSDPNFGTAIRAFGPNVPYTSCGKTGTAEAGFAPHAWYVTFAPAENPQIAVAVMVLNSREGSEVAAPIARRILDYYFNVQIAPFPEWWRNEYEPLPRVEGGGSR